MLIAFRAHWRQVATLIGAGLGGATLIDAYKQDSAPKQAAVAAMAVALAVIPYCFARAISELPNSASEELKAVNEKMAVQTRLLAALANAADPVETKSTE